MCCAGTIRAPRTPRIRMRRTPCARAPAASVPLSSGDVAAPTPTQYSAHSASAVRGTLGVLARSIAPPCSAWAVARTGARRTTPTASYWRRRARTPSTRASSRSCQRTSNRSRPRLAATRSGEQSAPAVLVDAPAARVEEATPSEQSGPARAAPRLRAPPNAKAETRNEAKRHCVLECTYAVAPAGRPFGASDSVSDSVPAGNVCNMCARIRAIELRKA